MFQVSKNIEVKHVRQIFLGSYFLAVIIAVKNAPGNAEQSCEI